MLANIPQPQQDQTMESLATLTVITNGIATTHILKDLLGLSRQSKLNMAFHHRSEQLFRNLGGAGYLSCADFLDRHGSIGFFRPFAPSLTYERAIEKLISKNTHGIAHVLGINGLNPFKKERHYCRQCALSELHDLGYAYAHRTHQIKGVARCVEHDKPLGTAPAHSDSITELPGLLVPKGDEAISVENLVFDYVDWPFTNAIGSRFSTWVQSVFTGELTTTPVEGRLQLIRDKLISTPLPQQNVPSPSSNKLDMLIRYSYPESFLEAIGFPTRVGPTAHWPSFLNAGQNFTNHPVANLLVFAALFDSPALFNRATENLSQSVVKNDSYEVSSPSVPRTRWSLSLVKDILRLPSLETVAKKYGIHVDTLYTRLRSNPRLKQRRKENLATQLRDSYRKKVNDALAQNPKLQRVHFRIDSDTAYVWLMNNDRQWFTENLPPKESWAVKNSEHLAQVEENNEDEKAVILLKKKTLELKNGRSPIRITKTHLLRVLGPKIVRHLSSGVYPKTAQALDDLPETIRQHEHRILERLDSICRHGTVTDAKEWATAIIQKYAHRRDILATVVDRLISLTARKTPENLDTVH